MKVSFKYFVTDLLLVSFIIAITACEKQNIEKKISDCQYTVVRQEDIPDELAVLIEERQEKAFRMTYEDQGYLYIIQGYGIQNGGGYSITVDEVYETKNQICFVSTLHGPKDVSSEGESTPYVVVKLEQIDKVVNF